MNLRIERTLMSESVTLGVLSVDGAHEAFTREPPVRSDRVFIAGESALPPGLYTVSLTPSRRFLRTVPLAVSAQLLAHGGLRQAFGMRFVPGHYTLDTDVGIVVGQTRGTKDVHVTRAAFEALAAKLVAARDRCEAIELEITQP